LRALGLEERECRAEAELILRHFTKMTLSERLCAPAGDLDADVLLSIESVLARRRKREPLQYCLGETHFFGRRFVLRPGVLIPRQDTETLVEAVLARYSAAEAAASAPLRLGEIGIGSGIISVSLLSDLEGVRLSACDISSIACELSRENAQLYGVNERLDILRADWREWLGKQTCLLDGIVSNPPYIAPNMRDTLEPEVKLWEPDAALFGPDEDGLGFYREFAACAKPFLNPGASVFLEIGFEQADQVAEIFAEHNWLGGAVFNDLNGIARVLSFVR
jgi:release factor glutamine methyltransferase